MGSFQMDGGGQAQDFVLCLQLPNFEISHSPEAACQYHPDAIHTTGSSHLSTSVLSLQMRRLATCHRHARDSREKKVRSSPAGADVCALRNPGPSRGSLPPFPVQPMGNTNNGPMVPL